MTGNRPAIALPSRAGRYTSVASRTPSRIATRTLLASSESKEPADLAPEFAAFPDPTRPNDAANKAKPRRLMRLSSDIPILHPTAPRRFRAEHRCVGGLQSIRTRRNAERATINLREVFHRTEPAQRRNFGHAQRGLLEVLMGLLDPRQHVFTVHRPSKCLFEAPLELPQGHVELQGNGIARNRIFDMSPHDGPGPLDHTGVRVLRLGGANRLQQKVLGHFVGDTGIRPLAYP